MEKELEEKWKKTKERLDELATGQMMNDAQFKILCEFAEMMKSKGYHLKSLGAQGRLIIWEK